MWAFCSVSQSFIPYFDYSINQYLLNTYFISGIVLTIGDTKNLKNKETKTKHDQEAHSLEEYRLTHKLGTKMLNNINNFILSSTF